MSTPIKDLSSDDLVKLLINTITELSNRGVNFFHWITNAFINLRFATERVKKVVQSIRKNRDIDSSTCTHTRIRFITESVKKIPEGYTKMQEKKDVDIERDYETVGYFVNKHICDQCGKFLFTDEL